MLLPLVLVAAALQSPDAPKMATTPAAASAAPAPSGHVEAGLAAYKRGRMAQAQAVQRETAPTSGGHAAACQAASAAFDAELKRERTTS